MKVKIDSIEAALFDQRTVNGIPRGYYTVAGYGNLLLVTHGHSLAWFEGKVAIALFGEPDSRIVADVLPGAPARWRNEPIVQCTIKQVERLPRGKAIPLSEALARRLK